MKLRFVVFQDEGKWVAQCVDVDMATQSSSLASLRGAILDLVSAQRLAAIESGREPWGHLPEPDRIFVRIWDAAQWKLESIDVAGVPGDLTTGYSLDEFGIELRAYQKPLEPIEAEEAELAWRDFDAEGGRQFDRTQDRSPDTFLRRSIQVRNVLGCLVDTLDPIENEDMRTLYHLLDDAIADFRGDRMPRQMVIGEDG